MKKKICHFYTKKIKFIPAVELSYLTEKQQEILSGAIAIEYNGLEITRITGVEQPEKEEKKEEAPKKEIKKTIKKPVKRTIKKGTK